MRPFSCEGKKTGLGGPFSPNKMTRLYFSLFLRSPRAGSSSLQPSTVKHAKPSQLRFGASQEPLKSWLLFRCIAGNASRRIHSNLPICLVDRLATFIYVYFLCCCGPWCHKDFGKEKSFWLPRSLETEVVRSASSLSSFSTLAYYSRSSAREISLHLLARLMLFA